MTATITAAELERFECDGYLMVRDAIDPARWIEPVTQEYETVLERLAVALLAAGRIGSLHDDLPFDQRLVEICAETNETNAQYFDFSLPQSNVRHETPMWHGTAVFEMLRCPGLLDLVECFIGPEIFSNPVQHVRMKVPESREPRDPVSGALKMGGDELAPGQRGGSAGGRRDADADRVVPAPARRRGARLLAGRPWLASTGAPRPLPGWPGGSGGPRTGRLASTQSHSRWSRATCSSSTSTRCTARSRT